jgi:DNA-binding MarR family transcriptional regulator
VSESPSLAYWAAAVLNRDGIEPSAYARLASHPRFIEATRQSARAAIARHTGNALISRTIKDIRRVIYGFFVLYLDARGELSLKAIRDVCVELGFASPGYAAAILLRLRVMGFVTRDTNVTDKRVRRYIPSPLMKKAFLELLGNELLAFGIIEPEAFEAAEALKDPEVFRFFALNGGRGLSRIVKRGEPDRLHLFATRDVGIAILHEIALSGAEGDTYPPKGPVRMAVAPLARKFGVSRSHVLRLLRAAEKQNLLRRDADEMTGYFEENLREALLLFQASGFLSVAASAYQAMNDAHYRAAEHA